MAESGGPTTCISIAGRAVSPALPADARSGRSSSIESRDSGTNTMWARCTEAYSASASIPLSLGSQADALPPRATTSRTCPAMADRPRNSRVLGAQAITEPIALTFRGPLVRHRFGPRGSHIRGEQDQHAAVLPCVNLGRTAHLRVLIVLGDMRDDGDASQALVRVAPLRSPSGGRHRHPAARRLVRANAPWDRPLDPSRCWRPFVTLLQSEVAAAPCSLVRLERGIKPVPALILRSREPRRGIAHATAPGASPPVGIRGQSRT